MPYPPLACSRLSEQTVTSETFAFFFSLSVDAHVFPHHPQLVSQYSQRSDLSPSIHENIWLNVSHIFRPFSRESLLKFTLNSTNSSLFIPADVYCSEMRHAQTNRLLKTRLSVVTLVIVPIRLGLIQRLTPTTPSIR